MGGHIRLGFGALTDTIDEQLLAQNVKIEDKDLLNKWQKLADSITRLYLCDLITPSEAEKIRQKFVKKFDKSITEYFEKNKNG